MRIRSLLLAIMAITFACHIKAQDKINIKYGKVSAQDFDLSSRNIDTSAAAVVIADIGDATFEVHTQGYFQFVFRRHRRIKILKQSAIDNLGAVSIQFYRSTSMEEIVDGLKACTYNLENGKVIETKVESKNVFKEKVDENTNLKKFAFANVKEGSIIEFTYTITSAIYNHLRSWAFQGDYPTLWSEYSVTIPEYIDYVFLGQGSQPYFINTNNQSNQPYTVTAGGMKNMENGTLLMNTHRWVMKDVPALKEEYFTSTINNHIAKVEFQLNRVSFPGETMHEYIGNWTTLRDRLMEDEDFGASLKKNNNWLDDEMPAITKGASSELDKAKKIYAYVRDNFTCTDASALYTRNPLKTVFKNRSGNVAEINLLLVVMLRHEKISSDPLILSTRKHGFTSEIYPLITRFNYVVARTTINSQIYELDASIPRLGFNHLDPKCYNGHARVVNETMEPVYLFADSLLERKITVVSLQPDSKKALQGSCQSVLGYGESLEVRGDGEANYFKAIQTAMGSDMELTNKGIDSLKMFDEPVAVHYNFTLNKGGEDMIYINPLLFDGIKQNYFATAQRLYPVEMPNAISKTYVFNMQIPDGYDVDEMPKSARAMLNDGEGSFDYLVGRNENIIQLKATIKLNKANFSPEDYNSLRDFYALIVKKENEQIVLKKKK